MNIRDRPPPRSVPFFVGLARQFEEAPGAAARDALTEAFRAEAVRTGTALVEELDDDPGHRSVTFLWRGHRVTRNLHNGGHDHACRCGFLADALVGLRAPVLTWTRQGPRVERARPTVRPRVPQRCPDAPPEGKA
ncbi:hypothetical protein [Streptomyces sp. NPDC101178]|uniref:hypothetical protein n=1 Tax=Streptomyces sp. NPDC101178 TaxID=3366124 RepID=UPI0038047EC4